jgi:ABC-type multidrug transport system permease subunit
MRVIRRIASAGRTVVCTIHQPSAEVFFAFDNLLLLAPGGRQVYFGPLGEEGADLVRYLEALPGVAPLPSGVNPASWMLEVLEASGANDVRPADAQADAGAESTGTTAAAESLDIPARYSASSLAKENAAETDALLVARGAEGVGARPFSPPGFATQLAVVTRRSLLSMYRDPAYNSLRILNIVFLGVLFSLVYLRIDDGSQEGTTSKLAALLNNAGFCGVISFSTALPLYARERAVFYRERAAGTYAPEAYSLAIGFAEVPWVCLLAVVYSLIAYWAIGFRPTEDAFFTTLVGFAAFAIDWVWIAQWFAALFPNERIASIFGGIHISFVFLFSGVFIPVTEIGAWKFMYYAVPSSHSLRLMAAPQFFCEGGAAAGCPQISAVVNGAPATVDQWEYVRDYRLGMDYSARWTELGWLVVIGAVFRVMTMLALRFVNHQRK